jgi:hypothetical protein
MSRPPHCPEHAGSGHRAAASGARPFRASAKERNVKKLVTALAIACATVASGSDGYYRVSPKRIDANLYRDVNTGLIIETRYCYEYAYGEDAILKYDRYSYDNKLIFDSGNVCDVVRVAR